MAVIGANGKLGQMIVKCAQEKEIDVWAFVRSENKSNTQNVVIKDLFDLNRDDLKGFDVVVNSFGTKIEADFEQFKTSTQHLANLISGKSTRLIVVGGAGSLYLDESLSRQLYETEDFPDFIRPTAFAASQALEALRHRDDVQWTYISPAILFDYKAERSGTYKVAGEILTYNQKHESRISYADYALALVDEVLSGKNIQKRILFYQEN